MRKVVVGLTGLLLAAIMALFFFAASGAFNTAPNQESFQIHRSLGYATFLIALVLTVFAAVARMPGRLIGMAGLVTGLIVVQAVIRVIAAVFVDSGGSMATAGHLLFGLHAVNGMIIFGVAESIMRQARNLPGSVRPAASGVTASGPVAGTASAS